MQKYNMSVYHGHLKFMPWVKKKKKKKEKKTSLNDNKHNTLENEAIEKCYHHASY